eukprot:403377164
MGNQQQCLPRKKQHPCSSKNVKQQGYFQCQIERRTSLKNLKKVEIIQILDSKHKQYQINDHLNQSLVRTNSQENKNSKRNTLIRLERSTQVNSRFETHADNFTQASQIQAHDNSLYKGLDQQLIFVDQEKMQEQKMNQINDKIQRALSHQKIAKYYNLQRLLGEGSYGVVHFATDARGLGLKRAVKSINKEYKSQFLSEANSLLKLDHPNIVKLYDVYENEDKFMLVMEYCEIGNLSQLIQAQSQEFLDEKLCAKITYQILKATQHIHNQGLIHRDIKAENILISFKDKDDVSVKMCDFGLSIQLLQEVMHENSETFEKFKEVVGSPYYIAPEVLKKDYSQSCDIWSIGILLYFLISKQFPFMGQTNDDVINQILNNKLKFQGEIWKTVSIEAKDLISRMLIKNPINRISISDALNNSFIQQIKPSMKLKVSENMQPLMQNNFEIKDDLYTLALCNITKFISPCEISKLNKIYYNLNDKKDETECPILESPEINKKLPYSHFLALTVNIQNIGKQQLWNGYKLMIDDDRHGINKETLRRKLSLTQYNKNESEIETIIDNIYEEAFSQETGSKKECISFVDYITYMKQFKQ